MIAEPWHAVRRERLSELVARQLELAIRSGQYPAGSRLPAQRRLAIDLGVSRPVLRESLQLLELRGLIVTHQGSGTFVAAPLEISTSPIVWLRENDARLRPFYEFRQIIEPSSAALAAQRATQEEIDSLKRNIEEAGTAVTVNDFRSFVTLDIEFHALVAQMSHNPYLFNALKQIVNLETDARQVVHQVPGHLAVAHQRHVDIYSAIAARSGDRARDLMRAALVSVLQDIEDADAA